MLDEVPVDGDVGVDQVDFVVLALSHHKLATGIEDILNFTAPSESLIEWVDQSNPAGLN